MTSPMATGSSEVGFSPIEARLVGSREIQPARIGAPTRLDDQRWRRNLGELKRPLPPSICCG